MAAIVREYSETGDPAGSEELAAKYSFAVSPATIRNEMQELEKLGLITHPHTSAGRVPTDSGYRHFVQKLMHHLELSLAERQRIRKELHEMQSRFMELGRALSRVLSEFSHGAGFALLPERSVSTSGLSQVIDHGMESRQVRELADFLDKLEEQGEKILKRKIHKVEALIGEDAPKPLAADFSLVVSPVRLKGGKRGLIGIVGPKRMKYAKNIGIVEHLSKILSGGIGVSVFIIFNFPACR